MTILDTAHHDAGCAVIAAQWERELLVLQSADTTATDAAIIAAQQRVTDLTAQGAVPGDAIAVRDAYFQPQRDALQADHDRLDTIVNDATLGPLLYPGADVAEAAVLLALTDQLLAALDAVWTPGA